MEELITCWARERERESWSTRPPPEKSPGHCWLPLKESKHAWRLCALMRPEKWKHTFDTKDNQNHKIGLSMQLYEQNMMKHFKYTKK